LTARTPKPVRRAAAKAVKAKVSRRSKQQSLTSDTRQYQYSFVNQFPLVQRTCQLRPAPVLALVRLSLMM